MANEIVTYLSPKCDPDYRFTGLPLRVKQLDKRMYELLRDVTYRTKAGELCTIKEGFHFDFASVPRMLWWLYPPQGIKGNPYGIAALVHDWLLKDKKIGVLKDKKIGVRSITRPEADAIFFEILLYTGCRISLCCAWYAAVSGNTFLKKINPWGEKGLK